MSTLLIGGMTDKSKLIFKAWSFVFQNVSTISISTQSVRESSILKATVTRQQGYPSKMRRWTNVGFMLGQRRRRWANIKPTLIQRLMFAGNFTANCIIFISSHVTMMCQEKSSKSRIYFITYLYICNNVSPWLHCLVRIDLQFWLIWMNKIIIIYWSKSVVNMEVWVCFRLWAFRFQIIQILLVQEKWHSQNMYLNLVRVFQKLKEE